MHIGQQLKPVWHWTVLLTLALAATLAASFLGLKGKKESKAAETGPGLSYVIVPKSEIDGSLPDILSCSPGAEFEKIPMRSIPLPPPAPPKAVMSPAGLFISEGLAP